MSLTSELNSPQSWVNRYFKTHFANVTSFVRKEAPKVRSLRTRVPTNLKGTALMRIGTAVDYRIRLELGLRSETSTVIQNGISLMNMFGTKNTPEERQAWSKAISWYLFEIDQQSEEELAKAAIVLAQLDAGFRSGGMWSEDMVKVASGCREDNPPSWEDILNTAQPNETAEVLEMADLAKRTLQASPYTKLTLGPTFPGSNYVGGADADLIISQRLYEIKTTVKPRERLPVTIRQLIGYILLDWDDNHQIQQAAIYFSRQGETISWNLEELIASTSTKARTDVTQIREEFRDQALLKTEGWEETVH